MPVVELSLSRLQKLIGKNTNKKQILDSLPFLGLDIESLGRNIVRVEYSPNRPDYSTDFGIALGLQGILGISKGMLRLNIRKKGNYEIKVDSSTSKIRPFVTGIIARNGSLDDEAVKQIINMQEDLHFGLGRKRKKSSIGIHDLDRISFPLKYTTTSRDHRFVPLNSTKEIEKKIYNSKENLRVLKNKHEMELLEFNYLTTPEKLMEYQSKYFENELDQVDIKKLKKIALKKNQLEIKEFIDFKKND